MAVGVEAGAPPAVRPPPNRRVRSGPALSVGWTTAALLLALLLATPILVIGVSSLGAAGESWDHVARTLLPRYVRNTVVLVVASCGLALVTGVGTAWLVSACEFPGRRLFRWALVLPLAVPAYMAAYTYAAMLDVTGPVQKLVRAVVPGAANEFLYWDVMRIEVVAAIFGLVLFPYVYLPTRALFDGQSGPLVEAARTLGRHPLSVFTRVAVPMARPAIAGGLALVAMEVFNDYGAVAYYGVSTFTTGIFRAWFSLGDVDTAIRLSALLMLAVFAVLLAERWQRRNRRYATPGSSGRAMGRYRLRGARAWAAVAACLVPLLFGFLIPVTQLGIWTARTFGDVVDAEFLRLTLNSFGLAAVTGLVCLLMAVVILFALRLDRSFLTMAAARLSILGYSIPGAVIAVGVLVSVLALERWFGAVLGPGTLVSGTVLALLFAYTVRFMAVAYLPVEAGFARVGEQLDAASRTLGAGPGRTLWRVDLPLLKASLLAALTLVIIDVLKELPL
ncbi:MAG TPA: iron ABC transporter permease, partial [Longimicrobiales bacterium]|nr:iron ABC transporter permease [Longimicrobiales bacterium]